MALIFGETDARFHRRKGRDTVPHLESAQNVLQSGVAIGEYGPQRYLVQFRSRGMHVLDHWHDRIVHTTFLTALCCTTNPEKKLTSRAVYKHTAPLSECHFH